VHEGDFRSVSGSSQRRAQPSYAASDNTEINLMFHLAKYGISSHHFHSSEGIGYLLELFL